MSSKFGTRAIN